MKENRIETDQTLSDIPSAEPERQYYFIEKARKHLEEMKKEAGRPLTFCVTTFGCQMNARDSEKLTGILEKIGYVEEPEEEKADFVIYNTCTVRENANLRVYGRLGQLGRAKKKNPHMMIALCGCMMQEPEVVARIKKSYRHVDIIFGTHNIYKLAELIYDRLMTKHMVTEILDGTDEIVEELPIERKYPFKSGVNIMFGCNNFCTYCIVPYVRGRERSRKPEEILKEVKSLAASGVKEIQLLGQNVNSYGKTLEEPVSFASLLYRVAEVEGIERIRFMTSHPKDLSEELIAAMRDCPKVCPHFHLPLQSGSSRILERMNRRYTKEKYLDIVGRLREAVPDIAITTDIIVGFPGETREDFLETVDVVRKAAFDGAFTFIYSPRKGTPAAEMEQVREEEAKANFDELLAVLKEVMDKRNEGLIGKTLHVLAEAVNQHDPAMLTGRSEGNHLVHFPGKAEQIGQILPVTITEQMTYYLAGKIREDKEE